MRKLNDFWVWFLSVVLLLIANYLWALHDYYFWNHGTREFLLRVFKDWHVLKVFMLAFFGVSIYLIPKKLVYLVSWILLRWVTFEFACNVIPRSGDYQGVTPFALSFGISGILIVLFSIAPFIVNKIKGLN